MEPPKNQTMLEQRTGRARNQVTTKNNQIMHCTHTAESANVEVQNMQRRKWCCVCHDL
jgi:hypothetical protein